MPNEEPAFLWAYGQIKSYLHDKFDSFGLKLLSSEALRSYEGFSFVCGWSLPVPEEGINFKILIPDKYPFSNPRLAVENIHGGEHLTLKYPHIEEFGMLCLPALMPSLKDPVGVLNQTLHHGFGFLDNYLHDQTLCELEFQDEFISYWARKILAKSKINILSILPNNPENSEIYSSFVNDHVMAIGSSEEELVNWFKNLNLSLPVEKIRKGLFLKLSEAPIPPFPETYSGLMTFINKNAPEMSKFFDKQPIVGTLPIIFSAPSKSGIAYAGFLRYVQKPSMDLLKGSFPDISALPNNLKTARFNQYYNVERHLVNRADHDWIHGRDKDSSQSIIKNKRVLIIGAGALGSHVAVRLAQAGVGHISIIDKEILETANIGRHALGIRAVKTPKSDSLASEMRVRFPHLDVESFKGDWTSVYRENCTLFFESDLIISAMGEWDAEGYLNELQTTDDRIPPIIYGWLESRGAAAHAVLICPNNEGCLSCLLDESGDMRYPETEGWPNKSGLESEPGCGALFQPFGPIDLNYAEGILSDLAMGFLTGKKTASTHLVHAVSMERMDFLGGEWTKEHKKWRPDSFDGSFQNFRPIIRQDDCKICGKK